MDAQADPATAVPRCVDLTPLRTAERMMRTATAATIAEARVRGGDGDLNVAPDGILVLLFRIRRQMGPRLLGGHLGTVNRGSALAHQMVAVFHLRQFELGFGRLILVLDHGGDALALRQFETLLRNRNGEPRTL